MTNVTIKDKTLKLRLFVMKNTITCLDQMEPFNLWNSPISSFCQKVKGFTNEAESLKEELKNHFHRRAF